MIELVDKTFRYPTVLTIAGSDSGGGAGIQADIKTCSALGVYTATAITAITVQNTLGVQGIQAISTEIIGAQIAAVMEDIEVDAVKIGMLHNAETVDLVAEQLALFKPTHIVLDPVMISTSGHKLLQDDAVEALVNKLFPLATLITPNTDEAEFLTGIPINSTADMQPAAERLMEMGCTAVLMKGGHLQGNEMTDILFEQGKAPLQLTSPYVYSNNTHGTGCTLSSAIAAHLALGYNLSTAVSLSKNYMAEALANGANVKVGAGHGPCNHLFAPQPLHKMDKTK